jgi:hypothetical protein
VTPVALVWDQTLPGRLRGMWAIGFLNSFRLLYGEEKIKETIEWSAQLDKHGKEFSRFFLKSDFLDAA